MYAISYVYNRLLHYAFLVPLRLLVSLIHILFISGFPSVNSILSTFGKLLSHGQMFRKRHLAVR